MKIPFLLCSFLYRFSLLSSVTNFVLYPPLLFIMEKIDKNKKKTLSAFTLSLPSFLFLFLSTSLTNQSTLSAKKATENKQTE